MKKVFLFIILGIVLSSLSYGVSGDIFIEDNFNRSDSGTIGNGWNEISDSSLGSIANNTLKTIDNNAGTYIFIEQTFDNNTGTVTHIEYEFIKHSHSGSGNDYSGIFPKTYPLTEVCGLMFEDEDIGTGEYSISTYGDSGFGIDSGYNYTLGVWHNVSIIHDDNLNKCAIFYDGILILNETTINDGNIEFIRFANSASDYLVVEQIDNFRVCDTICPTISSSPISSLTLNKGLPLDDSQHITAQNFNFNGTPSNTIDLYNCTFYQDSIFINNLTNINITQNQNFTYNQEIIKANFSINCTNSNSSDIINWYNITFDFTEPFINILYPLNNINIDYTTNFYHNITLNDTNLDGYMIRYFLNISGVLTEKQEFYAENLTEQFKVLYNITNSSLWCVSPSCSIVMNTTAWDSHNPVFSNVRELKPVLYSNKIDTNENLIIYGNNIKYELNKEDKPYTYFYLSENKYKFKVTYEEKSLSHVYYINTKDWEYIQHSQYKGHFINRNLKRYFDNEGKNIKNVIVKQLNSTDYRITVEHFYSTDEIEYESIGDLNVNSVIRQFTLYEIPDLSDELLMDINTTLSNIENLTNSIEGGISMIALVIMMVVFFIVGIVTRLRIFISFSGAVMFILSIINGEKWLSGGVTSYSEKAMFLGFLLFAIGFFILGVVLQIFESIAGKDKQNAFYDIYK